MKLTNLADNYFRIVEYKGLEEVVRFPDGEAKRTGVPNSTVWVFKEENHQLITDLTKDLGCGMAAFVISEVNVREATDKIYDFLKNKRVLGSGNHFVDLCSGFNSDYLDKQFCSPHNILVLHTDTLSYASDGPRDLSDALKIQKDARKFRIKLGEELADLISDDYELLSEDVHNSVEVADKKIIYRKGAIKTEEGQVHIMPAHLGTSILFYAVRNNNMPPHASMPHGTGRSGPTGEKKVSSEEAKSLRGKLYIPEEISDSSLRSEHPSCYNSYGKIFNKLGKYIIPLGNCRILSYVGKV